MIAAALWSATVALALVVTLDSLRTDDFDGLNNILQIPLALPWFLLPIGGIWSHEADAWIAAGMGWLNALLVLLLAPSLLQRVRGRRGRGPRFPPSGQTGSNRRANHQDG